ncbi:MAG: FAD-dependent oxidoreductase [Chloroflexi bacterium]|nr:FAD-dependent oxidoreductase [Chloroflexota bacterium]
MSITWDRDTDVVVVGYGLSGAVAASVAHDAGAEVLIVEKGQYPGGCSILSGGQVKCAHDAEGALQYLTAISGGRMEAELIRTFGEALVENEAFVKKLATVDGAEMKRLPTGSGVYPFPGRESLYSIRISKIPGFTSFPWLQHFEYPSGVFLMKLAIDNVEARGIEVIFSAPARRLITDASGAVIGVVAESDGREVAIRARRAVILATGGFEHSKWYQEQFLQGMPFYSMAPLTHTGDGIAMAQKVGAALWHMWHIHGSYGFKTPESPVAYRHPFGGPRNPKRRMPWIVVDKFGSRYMNEYPPAPQDTAHRAMELFDADLPGYPRIPSYIVFDEDGREMGAIARPMVFPGYEYEWSKDNSREVEKGWIIRADTLTELAAAIRERCPENEGWMDAERLEGTVKEWNGHVKSGKDPFHRPPGTMMRIATAPFYAAEVWPIITNTQGGPVHNAKQQVVDSFGQVIPRLYSVGELGSFFGHLYELESNLGECFTSGRIAGQNAAAETSMPSSG